jgi:hypothetical protein
MRGGRQTFALINTLVLSGFLACGGDRGAQSAGDAGSETPPPPATDTTAAPDTAAAAIPDTSPTAAARTDSTPPPAKPAEVATATPPKKAAAPSKPAPAAQPTAPPPAPKPAAPPPAATPTPPAPAASDTPSAPPAGQATDTASAATQTTQPLRDAYHQAPSDTVEQAVYDGWKQYNLLCARCHGEDVQGTTIAPHLITSLKPDGPINTKELFVQTVCAGRPAKGMPAWCQLGLDMDKIQSIYLYVKGRSEGTIHVGRPAVKSAS